jgi:hypothetical protein
MFERPTKDDLDRSLSLLMHENRHKLMEECNRIKSDAIKAGALQSNRVVVTAVKATDDLPKDAMTQPAPCCHRDQRLRGELAARSWISRDSPYIFRTSQFFCPELSRRSKAPPLDCNLSNSFRF